MERKSIIVFASGSGTTFSAILEYSHRKDSSFDVASLISDRMKSGAVSIAKNNGVEIIEYNSETSWILKKKKPDMIVLAGFLKIIEPSLLAAFPDRIVNIHPSLLPSFGGKGFYGIKVHRAAIDYGVQYSGFTIHIVNSEVDRGPVIFQYAVPVLAEDSPESLQERIHKYELQYYPAVIQSMLKNNFKIEKNRFLLNLY